MTESAEILRGVKPAYTGGFRMTWRSFRTDINKKDIPARGKTPVIE
jgi:hypothetical protein